MKISTGEKSLLLAVTAIILICISLVYVKHHYLEQRYENCRYFARGVVEAPGIARQYGGSPAAQADKTAELSIPADFAHSYMAEYRQQPAVAQRYYRAYLSCLQQGGSAPPAAP